MKSNNNQSGRKASRITQAAMIVIGLSSICLPSWAAWEGYMEFTDPSGFYAQGDRSQVG